MIYLSQIIGKPVNDAEGRVIGEIRELYARHGEHAYPVVSAVGVRTGRRTLLVEANDVAELTGVEMRLGVAPVLDARTELRPDEAPLSETYFGRRLAGFGRSTAVRIEDLLLERDESGWVVTGVDVAPRALLQRLGFGRRGGRRERDLLDWRDVTVSLDPQNGGTNLDPDHLMRLHPADLARRLLSAPTDRAAEVLRALPLETVAAAMEELPLERQSDFLGAMGLERAADVVERMSPDDAADLLGELDESEAGELLRLMEREASEDVRGLLAYGEDTAGGLMTPAFATASPEMSVQEAIQHLRALPYEPELIYYVYVVESVDYDPPLLLGVASLRGMILSGLERRMDEVMTTEIYSVTGDTPAAEVARVIAEYNLLALPVLDAEGHLLGIVTVDDVMERLLPGGWRERVPRLFR